MMSKFSRRMINLLFVCLLGGGVLFAWQTVATLQTKDDATTEKPPEKTVSVHAAKRGNPFVNFTDGADLASPNAAQNDNSQAKALTSADFDADGVADLVTADSTGNLKFYRGINLRTGEEEKRRKGDEEPFELTDKVFTLNISPDYLYAGDFNADGKQDILATAKGANFLVLLGGDGRGNFSPPNALQINGNITALTSGEIGRKDGQTDAAVAFTNKSGAFLAVFEHPEGAFKHKPEIFKLPAPANDLAIGNLDEDFYADIAVAAGNILTVIHGRGQAYPWDLLPDSGIKRPAAFVASRKMPFAISALTVGRFGTKRGESLALLGQDGNVYQIESNSSDQSSKNIISAANYTAAPNPFVPSADDDALNLAVISAPQLSREEAEKLGLLKDNSASKNGEISETEKKLLEDQLENFKNTDKKDIERKRAETAAKSIEDREKAKDAFLKSIAGKPSTLANWNLKAIVSNSQFSGAAASGNSRKMLRVNVSDSNLDDILLLDSNGGQIQIVSQVKDAESNTQMTTQITRLETESNPTAILPLRLNMDALSDLVVLRQGAFAPSVVMTAPTETFVVTSTDDTGDCLPGNPCSLRNAILYSNSHSGVETIEFNLGGATITHSQELPNITNAVNINGSVNGNGQPSFEINGANVPAPASGLVIRTSNSFIYGLALNSFKSVPINNGQSQLGGSGITIFSDSSSPNNGNNVILNNFLGTDKTGSLDKGNAVGLLIFDSDNNQIIQNVISGNGSQQRGGIGIDVTAGNSNLFINNIVGLNSLGTGKVANSLGVFLTGLNNTFGGDGAGDGNTVSGNGEPYFDVPSNCGGGGLYIPILIDLQTHELLTFGNTISGNRLGTNPAGNQGLGNCYRGIETEPITGTVIGSITENGRNTISGNGYDAIWCGSPFSNEVSGFGFCAIVGNNIGTDISGTIPIRNDQRNIRDGANPETGAVYVIGNGSLSNIGAPGGTTPNGECTGFCNLISGNDNSPSFNSAAGVEVGGLGTIGIFNNYIGTNKNGTQAISNYSAVKVASTIYTNFSPTYLLGGYGTQNGSPVSFGNLISGNSNDVVQLGVGGNTVGNYFVLGNKIGTDASGTFAVPNSGSNGYLGAGVNVNTGFGFGTTQIGDTNALGRNIISGNFADGINLFTGYNVSIANNLIGLNSSLAPLGNGGNGINLGGFFGVGNVVGGGSSNASNIIQNNGRSGVLIRGANYYANNLRGNSISNNGGLGIDLNVTGGFYIGDGVTPNDCQDADSGANGLQNFPLLDAPVINGNGTVKLTGALLSRPFNNYAIDFYSSPAADSTNHGEGAIYIGSLNVNTDDHGLAAIDFTSGNPVNSSNVFSATATDIFGNTSEFSCNAGATCSDSFAFKADDNDSLLNDDSLTNKEKYERLALACFFNEIVVNVVTDEADTPTNLNNNICDVDPMTNGDQCTLRAAIQVAEHRAGFDNIRFAIPGAGVQTISPQSQLPQITTFLTIDGTSQPGYSNTPLIKLDGYYFPDSIGLQLNGGGAVVKGLSIVGFNRGISLNGQTNNKIIGCHIGINADGMTAPTERQDIGIDITNGSSQNQIGGVNPTDRNIISNNVTGIHFFGGANNNKIINNIIGGNISQTGKLPNNNGILLEGSNNNEIGVDNSAPNYIFGNNGGGIVLDNNSSGNKISGNRIGVNQAGNSDLGNLEHGIVVTNGANRNTIGGDTAEKGNIIGGHVSLETSTGVLFNSSAGVNNRVFFNQIGTLGDGISTAANKFGVVARSGNQIIGRIATPNVIGGNLRSGIFIDGRTANVKETIIEGNRIGTDGTANLGNEKNGIATEGDVTYSTIDRNVISGNLLDGILIGDGRFNTITANKIGTNLNGNNHLNNGKNGIFIRGGGNIVGGTNSQDGNVISGNTLNGIFIETGSNMNKIYSNLIGTTADGSNPLGNGENGVLLFGTNTEIIGNTVSSNTAIGIRIERGASDAAEQDNLIQENFIGTTSDGESQIGNLSGVLLKNGASRNTILSNVISGNTDNGVSIRRGSTANLIFSNHIGTNTDGTNGIGNGLNGVSIEGSGNFVNTNIISGNNRGVLVAKTDAGAGAGEATGNVFKGNKIGTNEDGSAAIPNIVSGISLTGGAFNNTIGGTGETSGNLVSGNGDGDGTNGRGIHIYTAQNTDGQTLESPHENKVLGNFVGINEAHTAALPNMRTGILVVESPGNIIGSNESMFARNVVGGNLLNGIAVTGSTAVGNRIDYNYVGITPDGIAIGNNPDGINIDGAPQTIIGFNNVSGNSGNGIAVSNLNANQLKNLAPNGGNEPSVTITGNRVGIFTSAANEVLKRPNGSNGMALNGISKALIGSIGQITNDVKNVVSGNGAGGILVTAEPLGDFPSADNIINSTIVGTDENGTPNIGNGGPGIFLHNSLRTVLGNLDPTKRNSIAGNGGVGTLISGALSTNNKLKNNFIGVAPNGNGLGNDGDGVLISEGAKLNEVGGPGEGEGNIIAYSGGAGVRIDETAGHCNMVDPNAIFGNTGLGIDIGAIGHTPNDADDADTGANNLQNYPEIVSKQIVNNELIVNFKIDSSPTNSNYGANGLYVEFFKSDNSGEGERFLGFTYYTVADYGGSLAGTKIVNLGNLDTLGITANDPITASVTDADNNTSEFFPPFAPSAANVSVGGRVSTVSGQGIGKAQVLLTDSTGATRSVLTSSFGFYRFEDVEVGQTYILSVRHKSYVFAPQIISVNEEISDLVLTAEP